MIETWPRWTPGRGAGGTWKVTPEDFVVEELPLAPPTGEGQHQWLWIEKVGRTTLEIADALARAADVPPVAIGFAGLKDREARTLQAFTVMGGRTIDRIDGARILARARTHNRLRVGHLVGNRFTIRVRGGDPEIAAGRLAILRGTGMPNYYGPQRVGGRAPADGRALLFGEAGPGHREAKFALSAWQALLFNRVLAERGSRRLSGDLVEDGGVRLARRHETATPTGPMFGAGMPWPEGDAGELENAVLEAEHLPRGALDRARELIPGTRRALWVRVDPTLEADRDGYTLRFTLPAGSYASVLLEEIG